MIEIKALCHSFDNKQILNQLNLQVEKGSIHSLIGTTGAGKTLLLRVLAGLEKKQAGTIIRSSKKISFVFQKNALFPWLTLKKNLELTTGKRIDHFSLQLKKFKLDEYLNLYPGELSGGTVQKFNLLRAFLSDSEVILLDEPFSHLDIIQRETLYEFTHELWKESKPTIILVTHDIDEALLLSHRISFLAKKERNITQTFDVKMTTDISQENILNLRVMPFHQSIFNSVHALLKQDLS